MYSFIDFILRALATEVLALGLRIVFLSFTMSQ